MTLSDFVVSPDHFVRYLRGELGLRQAQMKLPRRAILVFGSDDWAFLRRHTRGQRVPWNRWVAIGQFGTRRVVIARSQVGAPAAAIAVEEMIALGIRECLTFGACGSLVPWLHIGEIVIPMFAHSEDGTSRFYGRQRHLRPDPTLVEALSKSCERESISIRRGGTWTVDAPYRESRSRVRWLAERRVIAVEMEAAAVYAVARARGIRAASLFVVSDELGGEGWNPGFRNPAYRRAKREALGVVIKMMARARL